ncbi:MAG: hypothetical protein COA90_04985 [Gammaproteobacteria bacterium]|nr:MAG: hypothetical protein COA90_04985 [Gammaproteobacteria bacterium]
MLRHWFSLLRDELQVFIQPHRIELLRLKGVRGLRPQWVDAKTISFKREMSTLTLPDDWPRVIKQLSLELKEDRWQASTASVVLSSHFMRYAVVPWMSEISTTDEWQAYLNHHFVMAYGDVVKSWNLHMDEPQYKNTTFASAMPNTLHTALNDTFSKAKLPLTTIQPYFIQAVNQLIEDHTTISNGWLIVIENEHLTMSLIEEGEWCMVKSVPLAANIEAQIDMLIEREIMLKRIKVNDKVERRHGYAIFIHWPNSSEVKTLNIKSHRVINVVSKQQVNNRQAKQQPSIQWMTR